MPDDAFTAACGFTVPYGKHEGESIARVGADAEGLLYLDWLAGQGLKAGPFKDALLLYLKHPAIGRQVDAAIEDRCPASRGIAP